MEALKLFTCTFPPFSSTVFNFPPAKNPSERPSGDQKGEAAPSVPGMAVASHRSGARRARMQVSPQRNNRCQNRESAHQRPR